MYRTTSLRAGIYNVRMDILEDDLRACLRVLQAIEADRLYLPSDQHGRVNQSRGPLNWPVQLDGRWGNKPARE